MDVMLLRSGHGCNVIT